MSRGQLNKENMHINQVIGKVISSVEHRYGQYKTDRKQKLIQGWHSFDKYNISYLLKLMSILSLKSISPGSDLYLAIYVHSGVLCLIRRVQKLSVFSTGLSVKICGQ